MRWAPSLLLWSLLGCEPFQAEPLVCGGELVDPLSDARHCGACGGNCEGVRDVEAGRCVAGSCAIARCAEGSFDRNGDPADGCEVRPKLCGGAEVDVESDVRHCGGCGRDCGALPYRPAYAGAVACEHGVCVATACAGELVERVTVEIGGHPVEVRVCGPAVECRPSDEVCNGRDDDCDGDADEGFAGRPEVCNGVDDDCDGETDEDFVDVREVCDGVDQDCDGLVDEGFAGVAELCNGVDDDCDGEIDEGLGDRAERCNGEDDDCDGQTDEGLGTLRCGLGVCAGEVARCVDGVEQVCPEVDAAATDEVCNGLDDDCDGETDEGFGVLVCGVGACRREVAACADGERQRCQPGRAAGEVCNGEDDDCDGEIDELVGRCGVGACEREVRLCAAGADVACEPGRPVRELCNGVDDDCDGETDEALTARCGVGACVRERSVCADGVAVACEPGPAAVEVCDGEDGDCDGVHDLDDDVCPGCVQAGGRVELASWRLAEDVAFDLTVRDGTVLVAWRDAESLVVTGCDDGADYVGREVYRAEGTLVAGPRWVVDRSGGAHLLYEWTRADVDGVQVRRLSHLGLGGDRLDAPVDVFDRVVCRDEGLTVVESRVAAPRLEVVGLAEACDFAAVGLQTAALLDAGWRAEVVRLEAQAASATVCGAWRLSGAAGRSVLGVVTTAVGADEVADGAANWRLDLLSAQLGRVRVEDVGVEDGEAALVDDRGCPHLAVVDGRLVRVTLDAAQRAPQVVRTRLDAEGAWARALQVPVEPVEGDVRGVFVDGTFRSTQVGESGWAASWWERSADGVTLRMSTHDGHATQVVGCQGIAADAVTVLPSVRPLLVWAGSAAGGVDGNEASLFAAFAGTQVERCSGVPLGSARGVSSLRAVPAAARGESVALYWLRSDGEGTATLHRARLDVGNARAVTEVVAERVDVRGTAPYVVRRGSDGLHHLLFLGAHDDGRAVLEYRALEAP